ncbi:unnamed protein product [Rotaria sp. Silwood1]|nr:unnamed protein product [Rotaria sp. Silwood1]
MATSSSGSIPDVLPSQVLSVNPSLPTNKLLDNLTKNQRLLQSLPQNYEKRHFFTGLFKTLLDDFFYSHERADIQLYAAICLADIIRIYAPNLPDASPEKMLNMFLFLARQLIGLKKIDDTLFTRRYYLLENLSMVQSFIPAVNLEDNRGCQISTIVFTNLFNAVHMVQSFIPAVNLEDNRGCQISTIVLTNLFNAVQKKHSDQLKNLMIEIVSVILAEYETIPFSLLEILFARIIDPEKWHRRSPSPTSTYTYSSNIRIKKKEITFLETRSISMTRYTDSSEPVRGPSTDNFDHDGLRTSTKWSSNRNHSQLNINNSNNNTTAATTRIATVKSVKRENGIIPNSILKPYPHTRTTLETKKDFDIDTIDKEIFKPDKVDIPDRLIDFDNDDQMLTPNERLAKMKKKEEVRKMLSKQSMPDINELDFNDGDVHSSYYQRRLEKEREKALNLQSALAEEAKEKSRQVAELQQLNDALPLISSNSFYIPSSSIKSIFSYESTGNDNENDGIVKFKLVQLEKDLRNDDLDFRPKYTPQIFVQNKAFFRYYGVQIHVYYLSASNNFYLNIHDDEKINPKSDQQLEPDVIIASLNQWLPSTTTTTNLELFLSKLKTEYKYLPFGEQLLGYELAGHESYFIHRINLQNLPSDSKFFGWYYHLQTFLMFFIDIVPSINKNNLNSIVYIIYQQYKNDNGQISYTPIGFTTVYLYYAYPDKNRPQICEMLILPPYQRKDHGRRFLTAIYEDLRTNSRVQDITAEDPSDEFVALRDLVSLELCHKYLPDLVSKESMLKTDLCKLTKQETRRVHEMCLLQSINHNDDKQMKRFRLLVKQRLLELLEFDRHNKIELVDEQNRKIYITYQYEVDFEHYKNILQSYYKYIT